MCVTECGAGRFCSREFVLIESTLSEKKEEKNALLARVHPAPSELLTTAKKLQSQTEDLKLMTVIEPANCMSFYNLAQT